MKTSETGKLGENLACRFLMKQGFSILDRNYRKFYGELDVVAKKNGIVHFIEVKAVSRENIEKISYETDLYSPEENIHPMKLQRLLKAAQVYLLEKDIDLDWQMDALAVFIDASSHKAYFRYTPNINVS